MYRIAGGIVTVDDPEDRRGYNCHGFSVGVRWVLTIDEGHTFFDGMAYSQRRRDQLRDSDEVVALFAKADSLEKWHTARRLRGRWLPSDLYESKCGWEVSTGDLLVDGHPLSTLVGATDQPPAGLRIAHPLRAIEQLYGELDSYWVRDPSPEADTRRRAFLEREYGLVDFDEVQDSSALLDELCRLAAGSPQRG